MSRARPLALSVLGLVLLAAANLAGPGMAQAQASGGPAMTLLLIHPNDGVDPLGFAWGASDPFTARHAPLAPDAGWFDYPFLVADGIQSIVALPDPDQPYAATLQAYASAVAARRAEQTPVTLHLESALEGSSVRVDVRASSTTDLSAEDLHAWIAIAEDPVHYEPPSGLTNGVFDHRFTLRALADLGQVEWVDGQAEAMGTFALGDWKTDRLVVAAWLQQDAPSPRFDAREVVQATHAGLGDDVAQTAKGVLVELLSATWCDPCLYGDRAAEDLAIELGAAEALEAERESYLRSPEQPVATAALAVLLGALVVAGARRRGGTP